MAHEQEISDFQVFAGGVNPYVIYKRGNQEFNVPIAELYTRQLADPVLYKKAYIELINKLKERGGIVKTPGSGASEVAVDVIVNASLALANRNILRLDIEGKSLNLVKGNQPGVAIAPGFTPYTRTVGPETFSGLPRFEKFLKELKAKPTDFYPRRITFPCAVGGDHITPLVIEIDKQGKVKVCHFDSMGNPGSPNYEQTKQDIENAIKGVFGKDNVTYSRIGVGSVNNNCCSDWTAWFIREIATKPGPDGQLIPMDQLEGKVRSELNGKDPQAFIHNVHAQHFNNTNTLLAKLEGKKVSFDVNPSNPLPPRPLLNKQILDVDAKFSEIGFTKTNIQNNDIRVYAKEDKKVTVSSNGVHGSPGVYSLDEYKAIIQAARIAMPGQTLVISNSDPIQHAVLIEAAQAIKQEDKNFEFIEKKPVEKKPQAPEAKQQKENSSSKQAQEPEPERLQVSRMQK